MTVTPHYSNMHRVLIQYASFGFFETNNKNKKKIETRDYITLTIARVTTSAWSYVYDVTKVPPSLIMHTQVLFYRGYT